MHRFYVEEDHLLQQIATLTPEDARHALRVLRVDVRATREPLALPGPIQHAPPGDVAGADHHVGARPVRTEHRQQPGQVLRGV